MVSERFSLKDTWTWTGLETRKVELPQLVGLRAGSSRVTESYWWNIEIVHGSTSQLLILGVHTLAPWSVITCWHDRWYLALNVHLEASMTWRTPPNQSQLNGMLRARLKFTFHDIISTFHSITVFLARFFSGKLREKIYLIRRWILNCPNCLRWEMGGLSNSIDLASPSLSRIPPAWLWISILGAKSRSEMGAQLD